LSLLKFCCKRGKELDGIVQEKSRTRAWRRIVPLESDSESDLLESGELRLTNGLNG